MARSALALLLISTSIAVGAQAPAGIDIVGRIKMEGFQHSQVMETLSWLSDVAGPRLTGSTALRRAGEWARDRMTGWGLQHAALEPYGPVGRGWDLERFDLEMTAPQWMRITGYPLAFSPATGRPIVGTPVVVEIAGKDDFDKYRGNLRGAIVMNGRPKPLDIGFEPEAHRFTDEELTKKLGAIEPAPDDDDDDAPKSLAAEEKDWVESLGRKAEIYRFLASEGIAALIEPSPIAEAVRVNGFYDYAWQPTFPGFVFAREHYGRIMRLLDLKQPVTVSLSLRSRILDDVEGFDVVAEVPGVDPQRRSQLVMLGGHLDSWHAGTGATDNAAGCAVVMEAVRILKAIGVQPKRTIRIALWTGEEQDYFGSVGYVKKHFGDPMGTTRTAEQALVSAYFNVDNGSGRIRGVNLQGNELVRPIFEEWLAPFAYLGATTLTTLNTGGTDHMVFDAAGIPGFQFIQDPLNYDSRTHHTSLDVYEEALPDDLKQAAVIVATFVYQTAMRDDLLPRKPAAAAQ